MRASARRFRLGALSLIAPNDFVKRSDETRKIDGVEIVFAMAPDSEAPAEFYMFYPGFRVLNMAEVATHNFHNLLPLRGTEVRDALSWSKYLNEAVNAFGENIDVVIAQHHWPVFGGDRVRNFLHKQRNLYKYVHDQTSASSQPGLHGGGDRRGAQIASEPRR